MTLITDNDLNLYCSLLIEKSITYHFLNEYLTFLYNSGCRPTEPLLSSVFVGKFQDHSIIQPLKNNNPRSIPNNIIPTSIWSINDDYGSYYSLKHYDTIIRMIKKFNMPFWIYTIDKNSLLYLFRYNYVRNLKNSGLSNVEIQLKMGWKNLGIVNSYLTKSLYK